MIPTSASRLREIERAAALALQRGCAEELASIERFLENPLQAAEADIRSKITSIGDVEPILYRSLLSESVDTIAGRCWERVFDNVALRFRARFLIYAEALVAAQRMILDEAGHRPGRGRNVRRLVLPRIFAPPAPALATEMGGIDSLVLNSVAQLERHLREAIESEVNHARDRLVRLGSIEVARTHVALHLAQLERSIG